MKSPHTWQWQGPERLVPQKVKAGQLWKFRLPIKGEGSPPHCKWQNLPWPAECQLPSSEDFCLNVNIPPSLNGLYQIHYYLQLHPPRRGSLILKIESDEFAASSTPTEKPVLLKKKEHYLSAQDPHNPNLLSEESEFYFSPTLSNNLHQTIPVTKHYKDRYRILQFIQEAPNAFLFKAADNRLYGKKVWIKIPRYDLMKIPSNIETIQKEIAQTREVLHQERKILLSCAHRQLSSLPLLLDTGTTTGLHLVAWVRQRFQEQWEGQLTCDGKYLWKEEPFLVILSHTLGTQGILATQSRYCRNH